MSQIDLHTHTTFSDGSYTPDELMKYASKKGLKAIAVTDHDTIDGHKESLERANHYGIEFIPGVEVGTSYDGKELHILGLFIDNTNEKLLSLLKSSREMRDRRAEKIIEIFNADGIDVSIEDIKAFSGQEAIGRPHFAKFLISKGYYNSVSDAMKNYLGRGQRAYVARPLPTPQDVFDIIKCAGGISILAHPIQYRMNSDIEETMIEELKNRGLAGVEAIYSENSAEDTRRYLDLAKKYDLLISGGSDFHGDVKPGLDLGVGFGDLRVDYSVLDRLRTYIF